MSRGIVLLAAAFNRVCTGNTGSLYHEKTTQVRCRSTQQGKLRSANSSVVLFPGQGSQFVGMGANLLKYNEVSHMFNVAKKILGYDLLSLCMDGPQEELDKTVHCQPAVFVASLAAVQKLGQENPEVIMNCMATAGFSVGEFAALVFAGSMDFSEALYAVKVRAEAMQQASDAVQSGMLSVIGHAKSDYRHACLEAFEHCISIGLQNPVCQVASYLFPDGRVIAGNMQALEYLQENSRKFNFRRTKILPVSGAFHTSLMEPATQHLADVLKKINIENPSIAVYSNVEADTYAHVKQIQKLLLKQLVSPVKWEQTMHALFERRKGEEFPNIFEVGPGKQLGMMLKNCNLKAWQSYTAIAV